MNRIGNRVLVNPLLIKRENIWAQLKMIGVY